MDRAVLLVQAVESCATKIILQLFPVTRIPWLLALPEQGRRQLVAEQVLLTLQLLLPMAASMAQVLELAVAAAQAMAVATVVTVAQRAALTDLAAERVVMLETAVTVLVAVFQQRVLAAAAAAAVLIARATTI